MALVSKSCPMSVKRALGHIGPSTWKDHCHTTSPWEGYRRKENSKLTETDWNGLKTQSFTVQILREISRPALREHSAGPLSIPFACSGRHKIYSHQMKLSLGNEAGAGKTENIIWALVITLGIGWWRQIRKVAWSHPGLHDASNGIKREHHKVGLEEQHTALSDDFHS